MPVGWLLTRMKPPEAGHALGMRHPDIEFQQIAHIFEALETRQLGDIVGKFDRLVVAQQRVEKGPHQRPERVADDLLAALGDQRIDDVS